MEFDPLVVLAAFLANAFNATGVERGQDEEIREIGDALDVLSQTFFYCRKG